MIDAFYIFTKGGLLLWSTQLMKVKGEPIDRLIKEVLLEERTGESSVKFDAYSLKWLLKNEMDLFFVVVYQGILPLAYLEGMLSHAAEKFLVHVGGAFGRGMSIKSVDFDADFKKIMQKANEQLAELKKQKNIRSFADTKKGQEVLKSQEENGVVKKKKTKSKEGKENVGDEDSDDDDADQPDEKADEEDLKPAAKSKKVPGPSKFEKKKAAAKEANEESKKDGKQARQWEYGKVSSAAMKELDFSKGKAADFDDDIEAKKAEFLGGDEDDFQAEEASLSSGSDDEAVANSQEQGQTGRMGGLFKTLTKGVKNLTGGAVLTEEDLAPILGTFKTSLMSRNVAAEVADKLADSVRTSLVGKTTEKFTSMSTTVKQALKESMETLLQPKKSIDVLRAALAAKNAGRVYTIVFLGVNGVGKSTNLAKVAYYLKNKGGLDVLICACDTFRAGAVEQLKTHSRCLDVPLFERGYGKDPADIAKQAIAHASQNGHDVVLVDTAGRMQDNEPLMRALAKLVAINSPDLVLFVGEALVGNDAIDQVTKFNRSLIDFSLDRSHPRGIDGMLLTKYDTVDDKVGAALSMVYVTGQPIVFVGTGQKYTHLRQMRASEVARTLLS
mmetsp:Transcript_69731/g.167404  ORF Transcript_69731/g.167404 Transcript_69731/m.167404 type:complete len:613 (-) Transcript_69731:153-1991(-)|eukprot:CAMPEP_0178414746 /NCGR_PEP_ID=MMETSP0689_2-20121128/23196_1 /TAXON_ID=160604 /ORGANISM="Amphidinium massartii, Strain CS-259" /LENGTH=612 /DNA_ID=CAMNT_0020036047 /DNA_START=14 /DNA_END=1852 /DNA_ORIENTATION=+